MKIIILISEILKKVIFKEVPKVDDCINNKEVGKNKKNKKQKKNFMIWTKRKLDNPKVASLQLGTTGGSNIISKKKRVKIVMISS